MARKARRGTQAGKVDARTAARLDALYAQLPPLECKGLCAHSCIPIDMAPAERERVRQAGADIPHAKEMERQGLKACPALTEGRCTVHEVRPMICRLWGTDETMPCPHGCVPEGGWISRLEGHGFSVKTYLIGGWPPGFPKMTAREVAEHLRSEKTRRWAEEQGRRARAAGPPAAPERRPRLRFWKRRGRAAAD